MSNNAGRAVRVPEPKVFPPRSIRHLLNLLFSRQFLSVLPHFLPRLPTWLTNSLLVLIVLNIKSFPLVWHFRIFLPVVKQIFKGRTLSLKRNDRDGTTTRKSTGRVIKLNALPIGKDLFEEWVYTDEVAGFDDCDYMGHVSNSSYPRLLDFARTKLMLPHFYRFHSDGGRVFLGGSSFHFHREIPLGSRFEIALRVVSWDDKWVYLLGEFTSPTDPSKRRHTSTSTSGGQSRMSLSKSAQNLRNLLKEASRTDDRKQKDNDDKKEEDGVTRTPASASARTVYCTSISRYCFKHNRKTIPPWLVIATSGFGTWASTSTNWSLAESLREKYAVERGRSNSNKGGIVAAHEGLLSAYKNGHAGGGEQTRWQEKEFWELNEWEQRRVKGLQKVKELGGLAPSS
ncbi:unnamed protein product [Sympodiomycopsis kandeliae]